MLTACGGLHEDLGEKNISINLPPIGAAAGNSRSISGERLPALRKEVRKYRVTVNGITREGTGSSYEFTLSVGIRATVTVECLNGDGEVIVRAVKDFTVMAGDNNVNINLKNDGEEIIPASAAGRVTYDWGEASRHGNKNGLPSDPTTYKEGDLFTVGDGSGMTWEHAAQQSGFSGWRASPAIEPENSGQATDAPTPGQKYKMPKGGVVLTAQWQKNTYTITYDINAQGSGNTASQTSINQGSVQALEDYTIDSTTPQSVSVGGKNYTFTKWSDGNGNTYAVGAKITNVTGNITLMAQWSDKDVWTVTYEKGNTQATEQNITNWKGSDNVVDGESVTLPTLQATGYTFNGWQINGAPQQGGASYTPTQSVTATAQWTANSYAVTVSPGNGVQASEVQNLPSLGQQNYNATVQLGNEPTRTGYTFAGWDVTPTSVQINGNGNSRNFIMPAQAVTLTAQWTANSYAVTVSPGNSVQASEVQNLPSLGQQNYNATVQLGNEPTRTGYTFAGWDVTPTSVQINGSGNSRNFTMPAQAITLTAQWTPIQYTITYNSNNGSGTASGGVASFNINTANVTLHTTGLTRQGYTFAGWSNQQNSLTAISNVNANTLIGYAGNSTSITLYAVWEMVRKTNKANWEVGDIVLCDSTSSIPMPIIAIHPNAYADRQTGYDGVAVVYKNENNKVYIVGKVHEKNGLAWCLNTAKGYNRIYTLLTEMDSSIVGKLTFKTGTYTDGSTGLAAIQGLGDYNQTNYPAWYWANNYGTTQGLTGDLENNWYLPSLAELFDIWKANRDNSSTIENALTAVGGNAFGSVYYGSSSQSGFSDDLACTLGFSSGGSGADDKINSFSVCAVRQFTY